MKIFLILFLGLKFQNNSYWDTILTNIQGGQVKAENLEGKIKILGSEYSQLKTYSELTKSIKEKKKGYKDCLEKISDSNFSEDAINLCVGVDFEFFDFDIDYERMKV